jgi:sigma-B regulation protein RsbU (phosphoserine phosphatase)
MVGVFVHGPARMLNLDFSRQNAACWMRIVPARFGEVRMNPEPPPGPVGTPAASEKSVAEPDNIESRAKLALEAAGVGTWIWEVTTGVLFWDDVMHRLCGVKPGNFAVRCENADALIHPEDRERVRAEVARAGESEAVFSSEYRVVWPSDGSVHFLRARGKIFRDGGSYIRLTGACWDITERKRIEQDLANERFLLSTLMENMPDKIYFKDADSRFLRVSDAMVKWFGACSAGDVIGKTDFDFFSREHALAAFEDEQRIVETGQALPGYEEKETWPDGHETWVSTTKLPLRDPTGRIIGTFGLSRDISDRRRAEAQLAHYAEELRHRNEELEEDLEMARELQSALMPRHYPCFPPAATSEESALHFSHFFNPSKAVSGDFFDILPLSDTTAGIFICDVMGHGMRAALVAALVRALVEELKGIADAPGEFLAQLNAKLTSILKQAEMPIFASAAYVIADTAKNQLRYANAGHPAPLCIHHEANAARALPLDRCQRGPVLGMFSGAQYGASQRDLSIHDMVLLFTDGLFEVEGTGGELYDQHSLMRAVNGRVNLGAGDLCREVLTEIQQFSANKQFSDDVCLVAVEVERLAS